MTQGFAKKNSFTAVQLNNMCKFYSDIITLTGGAGDKTVNLPFDWTGGTLEIEISTSTSVYEGGATYFIYKTTYDALTSAGYTSNQISAAINSSGILTALTKSTNTSGMPKSATTTSFTLDDDGTTVYVKYRVWAPYTATIQMDGSNIVLSGSGIPTSTPEFVGQQYIDITAKREYRAYGTSSSADWLKQPKMLAMVNFNGTTAPPTINSSYNVSSVTKTAGAGRYIINFTSTLPTANYIVSVNGSPVYGVDNSVININDDGPGGPIAPTTSSFAISVVRMHNGTNVDIKYVHITIWEA
jgi:hypothetical protein